MEKWTWTTFSGKIVTGDTIDQQHVSNILWYSKIIDQNFKNEQIEFLKKLLTDKFNGQILPYRPHNNFLNEIDYLHKKGMLNFNLNKGYYEIFYNNLLIGEIISPNILYEL